MRTKLKKLIITIGYFSFKCIRSLLKWYWKKFNIQTSGVRVMLVCCGEIVLVRHWYNSLWVMPGGGIKKHETPERAAIREIREEIGITIEQLDYKLGVYSNTKEGKNDIVHCFVVELKDKFVIKKRFNLEVSDVVWKSIDNLPEGTSKATIIRIKEYVNKDISHNIRRWS